MDQLTAPKDAFPTPCSSSQVEAGNQLVGKCHFWFRKHLSTQRELLPLPQGMLFSLRSCSERWQTLDSFARFLKSCAKRTPSCTESRRSGSVSYESQIHVKHKYLQGRQEQLVQLLLQLAGILWPSGEKKKKEYSTICFYFWSCLCTRQLTSATCSPFAQRMFSLPSSPLFPFPHQFFLPFSAWFIEEMNSFIMVSLCVAL